MINFNTFGDCDSDVLGSGQGSCDITSFGDPTGIVIFNKGWSLDASSDTLDEATYKTQLKSLSAFPFLPLYNFEQNTPENEKNTSSTGVLTEIRAGKPQFSFMFDKGGCFHKSLFDKSGKNRWDLGIVFDKGVLLASSQDKSKLLAFDMGMFSVETFKLIQGTDPQMSTAILQLLDAVQFNKQHEFFDWETLGFNMNRIDGVIETSLSYSTAPSAATTFSVKVVGACNNSEVITGLDDAAEWRLGGVQAAATAIQSVAYNTDTESYDFTLDVALQAADTIQPELYNTANDHKVVEDAIGNMFKGKAVLATIS